MRFRVSSPVPRQTGRAVAVIQRKSSSKSLRAEEARLESREKVNAAALDPLTEATGSRAWHCRERLPCCGEAEDIPCRLYERQRLDDAGLPSAARVAFTYKCFYL